MCLECIEWAKSEKRTFLRQALEVCACVNATFRSLGIRQTVNVSDIIRIKSIFSNFVLSRHPKIIDNNPTHENTLVEVLRQTCCVTQRSKQHHSKVKSVSHWS